MAGADVQLGCIADDLTGAADLANELTGRGLRTIQVNGVPPADAPWAAEKPDAVVISLKTRSIDAGSAVERSLAALEALRRAGAGRVYFKYCSTFDSTPAGNIGPVLEALAAALRAPAVIACPAFPAAGRTVYQGHLFVGDRLLSESGMQHHPLTPMRDADLVRVLQAQMKGRVALLPRAALAGGAMDRHMAALAEAGAAAVVADAIDDADLFALGRHCASVRLSSGGSGLGGGIARALAGPDARRASAPLPRLSGRRAIIAGSCSPATRRQVAAARTTYPSLRIGLTEGISLDQVAAAGRAWIDAQDPAAPVLVYSTGSPDEVAAQRSAWPGDASAALEHVLAELAAHLLDRGVDALLVAGGETSGAVVQRLGCETLRIGPEIDPGVPWTIGAKADGTPLLLALKSGNFGSDDFMVKAWEQLA